MYSTGTAIPYSTEVATTREAFAMETAVWALFVTQVLRRANSNILFRWLSLAGPGANTGLGIGIKHVDLVSPSFLVPNDSLFCARCDISSPRSH